MLWSSSMQTFFKKCPYFSKHCKERLMFLEKNWKHIACHKQDAPKHWFQALQVKQQLNRSNNGR